MNIRESRAIGAVMAVSFLFLAGCGGSGNSDDTGPATGTISFGITDLPAGDVSEVVISMTEFELKPAGEGRPFRVPVNAAGRELDLLDFQNGAAATIIDGEEVPAGNYAWLRIFFDEAASYVTRTSDGGQFPLFIPSGDQTGYKLQSGFTVPINGSVTYMLHIDVDQSLHQPPGLAGPGGEPTYLLKPVVEIMNVADTGSVMGEVDIDLIDVNNSRCNVPDPDPDLTGNAVYIFDGADALVDDIANPNADGRLGPFATDRVELNIDSGKYEYTFAYVLPGTYTIAFTCSTSADDEISDDDFVDDGNSTDNFVPGDSGFDFDQAINVEVQSNVESNCPIPAGDAPETCTPTP